MNDGDKEFERAFPGKTALEVFPMDNKATACPRCGLEFKTLLHPLCQHTYCPAREFTGSSAVETLIEAVARKIDPAAFLESSRIPSPINDDWAKNAARKKARGIIELVRQNGPPDRPAVDV